MVRTYFVFLVLLTGFLHQVNAKSFWSGVWYRNDPFSEANITFTANGKDIKFKIEAVASAHEGELEGKLSSISAKVAKSHVVDSSEDQKCDITFQIKDKELWVSVVGDMVGAGATVSYEGEYTRNSISISERDELALKQYFPDRSLQLRFKAIAGEDLDYLLQCFYAKEEEKVLDPDLVQVIRGWFPGVAPWENAILGISKKHLYLAFVDSRKEPSVIRYRSDGKSQKIPMSFHDWREENKDFEWEK